MNILYILIGFAVCAFAGAIVGSLIRSKSLAAKIDKALNSGVKFEAQQIEYVNDRLRDHAKRADASAAQFEKILTAERIRADMDFDSHIRKDLKAQRDEYMSNIAELGSIIADVEAKTDASAAAFALQYERFTQLLNVNVEDLQARLEEIETAPADPFVYVRGSELGRERDALLRSSSVEGAQARFNERTSGSSRPRQAGKRWSRPGFTSGGLQERVMDLEKAVADLTGGKA